MALGTLALVLEAQTGVQGQEGLDHLLVVVVDHDLGLFRLLEPLDLRHDADQGQPDHRLDIEGALHPVVDVGHEEGEGRAERQAAEKPRARFRGMLGE
jgi:hypothetical protein